MSSEMILRSYPADYPEKCFQVWYASGCPPMTARTATSMPEYEGSYPTTHTLRRWAKEFGWKERADALNQKALELTDANLVEKKVALLKELADSAKEIQTKALKFLKKDGFDSSASAVTAFFKGAELRLDTAGLSDALRRLSKMDDRELNREMMKLVERARGDDVIQTGEFTQTENTEDQKEDTEYEED